MTVRLALLGVAALLSMAAGPRGSSFTTAQPMPDFRAGNLAPTGTVTAVPPGFVTAPTPDQDAQLPTARASSEASLAPGLFTRREQYRGEGLSASSSAQVGQDRRVKPGAGFKLSMPLQ